MVTKQDPIRVYVSHRWTHDADYLRVFEFLESARNFFYVNLSAPEKRPDGGREAEREAMRAQIEPAEVVIVLAPQYMEEPALVEYQARTARTARKPVILLPGFGADAVAPPGLKAFVDEVVAWDERALADAIRRLGRHENTGRWDVIEFTLD